MKKAFYFRPILLLILGLPLISTHSAFAQTLALRDSVVVTANRFTVDQRLTGRRVEVISAEQIQQMPVRSVDELMRTIGGMEVQSRGAFGIQSDFSARGSGFSGVLILVDGIRFNDPQTGHFLSDFPIPLSEIERIEVLRGPASALYGADALGGVIQIFTKTATAKRPKSSASTTIGANKTRFYEGGFRFNLFDRLKFSAVHENKRSDGQSILNAQGNPIRSYGEDIRTDFTQRNTSIAGRMSLLNTDILVRFAKDKRDFSAWHFYTDFASDTAREATQTQWVQMRLNHNRGKKVWSFGSAYREHQDTYVYNSKTAANIHTSKQWSNQLTFAKNANKNSKFSGGLSMDRRSVESNNLGDHSDYSGGAFLSIFASPSKALSYTLGTRVEYDPAFGLEPMPQLNVAYNLQKATLRASAGRAIRAPGYTERFLNNSLTKPRGRNYGNPDLKPESAWHYEAGLDLFPQKGVVLHLTGFMRDTENLIDYVKRSPADTVWLAQNILSVNTKGFEADLNLRQGSDRRYWALQSSYTYLDANLGTIPSGVQYKYALTNAKHLLQNNLTLGYRKSSLTFQHLWKQPLVGDAYQVMNLKAVVPITLLLQWKLTFEVRNLADVAYTELFDAPMPRRMWLVGIRF